MKQVIYTYDDMTWNEYVEFVQAYTAMDAFKMLSIVCREPIDNCELNYLPELDASRFIRVRRKALDTIVIDGVERELDLNLANCPALKVIEFQEVMQDVLDPNMPVKCLGLLFDVDYHLLLEYPVSRILD